MSVIGAIDLDELAVMASPGYEDRGEWRERALCHGLTDTFFPGTGRKGWNEAQRAKAICEACPVGLECLAAALRTQQGFNDLGLWAGTSREDRKELRQLLRERR